MYWKNFMIWINKSKFLILIINKLYKTMLPYCLRCRKCSVRDSKNSKFIKGQEASGLLCSLGIKTSLKKFLY